MVVSVSIVQRNKGFLDRYFEINKNGLKTKKLHLKFMGSGIIIIGDIVLLNNAAIINPFTGSI